ncbi:MAG: mechanosensitive ion channel family protein [Gemmatimonadota bacterium]|jgi:small-conductance mechanosensitive channel
MDAILDLYRRWKEFLEPWPALRALETLAVFLVLAWLVDRLITGIVTRMVGRTETKLDDRLLAIIHRPIFVTVMILGVLLGVYEFDLDPDALLFTTSVVKTLLIIIWVVFGLRFSRLLLAALRDRAERFDFIQPTTEPILRNAVAVLLILGAAYAILVSWDIEVTGLVASAGIVGLALSFAAQDTLGNLFAGVAILTDRPYVLGDYIILDSGERGEVTHIGLRSTRLLTRDDVEVSIPNSVMGAAKIVNEASGVPDRYRIRIKVGTAYGSDIDHVMAVLLEIGKEHPKVRDLPEPRVRFRAFGESSLDFELLCWIERPADRGLVTHEINCEVYRRFAKENITIPFPQRDLYIKEMPAD